MERYKLVIADDEKLIRESLIELISWDDLGFEIVLSAEDGKQVIEFLTQEQADVVLSDIQMRNSTGLEVAKNIYDNKKDIKVVLLSGYQEFEFARKAIDYDVKEYLLKPISISGIVECFARIRKELDQERREQQHKLQMKEELENVRFGIIEKLLELGKLGVIREKEAMVSYLDTFGLSGILEGLYCCEAKLTTMYFQEYDDLAQDILTNIFRMLADKYGFYHIYVIYEEEPDSYQIIALADHVIEGQWVCEAVNCIEDICNMKAELNLNRQWSPFFTYLQQLCKEKQLLQQYPRSEIIAEDSSVVTAISQQFLLILNMTNEMEEITGEIVQIYFDSICHLKRSMQISRVENIIKCMLKLQQDRYPVQSLVEIEAFNERKESIEAYFRRCIKIIYQQMHQDDNQLSMVEQIKKLVLQNITAFVSLKEAAEAVFLSPNYFSRVFREQNGENFSEFCIKIKMEKAVELLKQPRYKVYEISDYLGYKNIKYFYKLFKRVYYCTPSEYRAQLKPEEGENTWQKNGIHGDI